MADLKQGIAYTRAFFMVDSADHISGKTGLTPTVTVARTGDSAFQSTSGLVSEISSGWYKIILTLNDISQLGDLFVKATAGGADTTLFCDQVVQDSFDDLQLDASGRLLPVSNIRRGQPIFGFQFVMLTTDSEPATGKTVSGQKSLDGAAFAACDNAANELSNGIYFIDLTADDLQASTIALCFSATGCLDTILTFVMQP